MAWAFVSLYPHSSYPLFPESPKLCQGGFLPDPNLVLKGGDDGKGEVCGGAPFATCVWFWVPLIFWHYFSVFLLFLGHLSLLLNSSNTRGFLLLFFTRHSLFSSLAWALYLSAFPQSRSGGLGGDWP